MVNHEHFLPTGDFDRFFQFFCGLTFDQVYELAKMDNEAGRFNQDRLVFFAKMWWSILELKERYAKQ